MRDAVTAAVLNSWLSGFWIPQLPVPLLSKSPFQSFQVFDFIKGDRFLREIFAKFFREKLIFPQGSWPGRSQARFQVSGTPWPETWTWPAFFGTPDLRPDLTCVFLRPPDLLTLTWDLQVWVTVCFSFSHPFFGGGCYFLILLLFSKLPHPIVS